MPVVDAFFAPRSRGPRAREEFEGLVEAYLSSLYWNGQLWGEQLLAWTSEGLRVTSLLPHERALSARYRSVRGGEAWERLRPTLAGVPRVVVVARAPARCCTRWSAERALFLFTSFLDVTSPVCAGSDGSPVPLYLLPVDQGCRQELVAWQRRYRTADECFMASEGPLEMPGYRELAEPESGLSREGRDLARAVEEASGLPTYYHVLRYWERPGRTPRRLCPGCGRPWVRRAVGAPSHGLLGFERRCARCRLVSVVGPELGESRRAAIGEWRGAGAHAGRGRRSSG